YRPARPASKGNAPRAHQPSQHPHPGPSAFARRRGVTSASPPGRRQPITIASGPPRAWCARARGRPTGRHPPMRRASLFPDPAQPVEPAGDRDEPTLWVRRLVVAAERRPGAAVIRDVSFRAGLNVVRVQERPAGETRPIGHSVGKTLLARLIRYCPGEGYFPAPEGPPPIPRKPPARHLPAEAAGAGPPSVLAR